MKKKATGTILILIALLSCWYYGKQIFNHIYYDAIIFCFALPIEESIFNTILGVLGVFIGVKVYQHRLKVHTAILYIISLFILGFLFQFYGAYIESILYG